MLLPPDGPCGGFCWENQRRSSPRQSIKINLKAEHCLQTRILHNKGLLSLPVGFCESRYAAFHQAAHSLSSAEKDAVDVQTLSRILPNFAPNRARWRAECLNYSFADLEFTRFCNCSEVQSWWIMSSAPFWRKIKRKIKNKKRGRGKGRRERRRKGRGRGERGEKEGKRKNKGEKKSLARLQLWLQQAEQGLCLPHLWVWTRQRHIPFCQELSETGTNTQAKACVMSWALLLLWSLFVLGKRSMLAVVASVAKAVAEILGV